MPTIGNVFFPGDGLAGLALPRFNCPDLLSRVPVVKTRIGMGLVTAGSRLLGTAGATSDFLVFSRVGGASPLWLAEFSHPEERYVTVYLLDNASSVARVPFPLLCFQPCGESSGWPW